MRAANLFKITLLFPLLILLGAGCTNSEKLVDQQQKEIADLQKQLSAQTAKVSPSSTVPATPPTSTSTSSIKSTSTKPTSTIPAPTTPSKKLSARDQKIAHFEQNFRDLAKVGINSAILDIDHNIVLAVDESGYADVAKEINTISALINIGEQSSNNSTSQLAYGMEDE